ncbi:MAG: superoxide dismutase family protein [Coxiellaceae bacterium]|nr:superoxide dismutase family protein [Coxiellaceae bacterium]
MRTSTLLLLGLFVSTALHATVVVDMFSTKPDHQKIGDIIFKNKKNGLMIFPDLKGLPPGEHGFHLHEYASCDNAGMAAGGHYDPLQLKKHLGPYHQGHQGDLPKLFVDKNGIAHHPSFAPHLAEKNICGHAVMIHAGGDNYSDEPKPLGGGGERIACGFVKSSVN